MPEWKPTPIWEGLDAFIIGGGTSLRDFDWSRLRNERTIGCNQAFRLGEEVCDIAIFGDFKFAFTSDRKPRKINYIPLSQFKNPVVSNDSKCRDRREPWLKWMPRESEGLHRDALGWNSNTGAAAINLALILGARVVYLLGFDMFLDEDGKPNWYTEPLLDKPKESIYGRMIRAFVKMNKSLPKVFPGCRIINITKRSKLDVFPTVDPDVFWNERKNRCSGYKKTEQPCLGSSERCTQQPV